MPYLGTGGVEGVGIGRKADGAEKRNFTSKGSVFSVK